MDVYCKSRNIKQLFSTPFSPYSNGLAERHVQATKCSLVRMDQRNLQDALYRYLATYRNTVSNVTNQTPSFMVFGREVRSVFNLIKPTASASGSLMGVFASAFQEADMDKSQNNARTIFREGEEVWAREFNKDILWSPAKNRT